VVRGDDEQLVGPHREMPEHGVPLGHERLPLGGRRRIERGAHDAALRRVEGRDADERGTVVGERERRRDLLAGDGGGPDARAAFEDVDVVAGPADEDVDDEPLPVGRDRDVGPGLRIGVLRPHDRVVLPAGAERVQVDGAVVLVAVGIAGVGEPGAVGLPRHAAGPGGGDRLAPVGAVAGIEDAEHGVLAAALAGADRDEGAVGRGGEPVDGVRRVMRAHGRVEQDDRRHGGVGGRPPGEQELLGARGAFDAEQVGATHLHATDDRQLHQRDEALVPRPTIGTGIERLTGVLVLAGDPLADLRRVTVFQPAIGVGDLDAVEDVDDLLAPGRRGQCHRRAGAISLAPCWGACRGWPWSGAAGPCASSSSST
jgi:hypothetical protein